MEIYQEFSKSDLAGMSLTDRALVRLGCVVPKQFSIDQSCNFWHTLRASVPDEISNLEIIREAVGLFDEMRINNSKGRIILALDDKGKALQRLSMPSLSVPGLSVEDFVHAALNAYAWVRSQILANNRVVSVDSAGQDEQPFTCIQIGPKCPVPLGKEWLEQNFGQE